MFHFQAEGISKSKYKNYHTCVGFTMLALYDTYEPLIVKNIYSSTKMLTMSSIVLPSKICFCQSKIY